MSERCAHPQFDSQVGIGRLTDVEGGPVTHYTAEIRVHCADCKLPFEWIGPPLGVIDANAPVVGLDRLELRIPIEPQHSTMRGRISVGMSLTRYGRSDA